MKNMKITLTCRTCRTAFRVSPSRAAAQFCRMECYKGRAIKHGGAHTKLYRVWIGIRVRCNNPNHTKYADYGGRGITVCAEWAKSFRAFRDWALANGYASGLEIDRRNTNGNYCPENCRWATRTQNNRNTRKKKNATTSKYKGVFFNRVARRWQASIREDGRTKYLGLFNAEEDAARAYDAASRRIQGEFANCNFPDEGGATSAM